MTTWQTIAKAQMKELGLTQTDLATPLGVSTRGAVGHYFTGRRNLNQQQASALCEVLKLSYNQLFEGSNKGSTEPVFTFSDQDEFITVCHYELTPSSDGLFLHADSIIRSTPISKDYLSKHGIPHDKAAIISIKGETMAPTLTEGDSILINTTIKHPETGKVMAFVFDSVISVRRFIHQIDGQWKIICDNGDKTIFPDEIVSADVIGHLNFIGQVKAIIERQL